MGLKDCTTERFHYLIDDAAYEAGVVVLLTIPGVWELVAEYFNNQVCELLENEDKTKDEDEEETNHES